MYQASAIQNEYLREGLGGGFPCYEEPDNDKRNELWIGGVMQCFSIITSLCGRREYKQQIDDEWEIPFESITDMVYLGAGAQGVVFGGNLNGELVAIKKLRDKSETNIKHLRKLNHDNIVRFKGVCTSAPTYCVVMEYCQYGPLYDFLHSGATFSTKQILKWAKEIALGMSYLHSHKIIHRDLKSPNVLISDNLVVKVSDFGTSREWNDVSATMSFTGTVAWMAPEVIRHELCSERVDVWSYGVVLWELLTQEIPYKNMEPHAIMWGVGTDSISLPIPTSCPPSLRALLTQCWHRTPKSRPPFKIIAAHLEIAGDELNAIHADSFKETQEIWREEIQDNMKKILNRNNESIEAVESNTQRKEELKLARNTRNIYEQQLKRANDLYMEVCAVRLQLEQKEKELSEREKALKECHCIRKKINFQRQISSSSDGVKNNPIKNAPTENSPRRRKKKQIDTNMLAQLIVKYEPKGSKSKDSKVITEKLNNCTGIPCECSDDSMKNNNMKTTMPYKKATNDTKVDLIIEDNGNIILRDTLYKNDNENFGADYAQV